MYGESIWGVRAARRRRCSRPRGPASRTRWRGSRPSEASSGSPTRSSRSHASSASRAGPPSSGAPSGSPQAGASAPRRSCVPRPPIESTTQTPCSSPTRRSCARCLPRRSWWARRWMSIRGLPCRRSAGSRCSTSRTRATSAERAATRSWPRPSACSTRAPIRTRRTRIRSSARRARSTAPPASHTSRASRASCSLGAPIPTTASPCTTRPRRAISRAFGSCSRRERPSRERTRWRMPSTARTASWSRCCSSTARRRGRAGTSSTGPYRGPSIATAPPGSCGCSPSAARTSGCARHAPAAGPTPSRSHAAGLTSPRCWPSSVRLGRRARRTCSSATACAATARQPCAVRVTPSSCRRPSPIWRGHW